MSEAEETALTERQRYWLEHVQAFAESGKTIAEYAAEHSLAAQAMYAGKKILIRKSVLPPTRPTRFQRAQVVAPVAGSEWRIHLPNGVSVAFSGSVDAPTLATVLNAAVAINALTHIGCMAHARRKFSEAVMAQGKKKQRGKAHRGLALIQKLYRVEKQTRKLTPEEHHAHRQRHARPILDELRAWLDDALPQVPPTSATGKALNYLNNEWDKLIRYLDDGRLEIDNNGAENAIRPFGVRKKN